MGEGESGSGQDKNPLVHLSFVPSPHRDLRPAKGGEIFWGFF